MINNAGVLAMGPIASTPGEEWHGMISANIEGVPFVTRAAIRHLISAALDSPRRVTDLVNVSATSARTQRSGTAVYSLTKSGIGPLSIGVGVGLFGGSWWLTGGWMEQQIIGGTLGGAGGGPATFVH